MNGAIPNPIAYTEARAYAQDHGLAGDRDEFRLFLRLLQAQDETFLSYHYRQLSAKTPPKTPDSPPSATPPRVRR